MTNRTGEITIDEVNVDDQIYMINKTYGYIAEHRNDDGEYWFIQFENIPEAFTQAIEVEQIEAMAADALETCIIVYLKLGKELP